ncbi:MAG TPA: cytochrome bc complex cytochrome b subunit [Mycobacteriales bacterium]
MSQNANIADQTANWADERLGAAGALRKTANKVFPTHWSFMLGEIALYSFLILVLTGTYLTLFFDASMAEVRYNGSYTPLRGIEMSRAYSSTLNISFDVRGGLVIRQIHHWAALLFVAAIVVHLLRTFFTGAFRKPRELNWLLGVGLLVMGLLEGFAGYSLPDDLLSGTGLRIASAIMLSIPVVGTWVYFLVFGTEFPGTEIVGRLYIAHVLLVPGIIFALIALHLALVVKNKHTQFPGRGRTERNVVGVRMIPFFATKGGGLFMVVFAMLALLGGVAQINPIWLYGPYNPAQVSAGSQPDWYIGWLDGSTRLWPSWEIHAFNHTISPLFWPTIVMPGVIFTLLALYPFIEAKLTRDKAHHHLLQRPRDVPVRTGLGAMSIAFYLVLLMSGGNDLIAAEFDISLNAMTWIGRIGLLVAPPIAYWVTYRICLGLQRHDREVLEHGVETGIVKRLPHGEYIEVHQPLGPVDEHGHGTLEYAGTGVPKRLNQVSGLGRAIRGFFSPIEEPAAIEQEQERERELAGRPKDPQS